MIVSSSSSSSSNRQAKADGLNKMTDGWFVSGSVHLMSVWCTEQGCEASPVYLRPHLRVLICFRLAASKEESIETVRQDSNALLKKRRRWKKRWRERESEQQGQASRGKRGKERVKIMNRNWQLANPRLWTTTVHDKICNKELQPCPPLDLSTGLKGLTASFIRQLISFQLSKSKSGRNWINSDFLCSILHSYWAYS